MQIVENLYDIYTSYVKKIRRDFMKLMICGAQFAPFVPIWAAQNFCWSLLTLATMAARDVSKIFHIIPNNSGTLYSIHWTRFYSSETFGPPKTAWTMWFVRFTGLWTVHPEFVPRSLRTLFRGYHWCNMTASHRRFSFRTSVHVSMPSGHTAHPSWSDQYLPD